MIKITWPSEITVSSWRSLEKAERDRPVTEYMTGRTAVGGAEKRKCRERVILAKGEISQSV
ncbi:hypothetical protein BOH73_13400 [Pseudomonas versuta]|uniref:Uncharacterized protein n=1 Tax=Pseudomonas versuta TaxID=1788301 RepID=A0ABX3E6T9_9PSED|nr:hypothetical protein AOC04_03380 [Pseudomonas versuta]OKA20031.1 hypothetical protein BOH73_13400 [Pseudomonas versuta]